MCVWGGGGGGGGGDYNRACGDGLKHVGGGGGGGDDVCMGIQV